MSNDTVTIGCKIANGLLLQVDDKTVKINGFNTSNVIGGHGITENVPADFWQAWLARNKDRDITKNGLIFAHSNTKDTTAEAKEKRKTKSSTEPISPPKNNELE
ncbi:hypothetical protein [Snodgrassella sp. ESL0324]|uniref:hypothetical protein n=1 Tax=Snodgrassella sp. ESL0324 TaxID=2705033 RepID=UPI0015842372|nr:hypothetical protein [Snodgrassella sp. ESL0324]NUF09793.1 hypothetical protein [Snodgrassella sp. ESL0324]